MQGLGGKGGGSLGSSSAFGWPKCTVGPSPCRGLSHEQRPPAELDTMINWQLLSHLLPLTGTTAQMTDCCCLGVHGACILPSNQDVLCLSCLFYPEASLLLSHPSHGPSVVWSLPCPKSSLWKVQTLANWSGPFFSTTTQGVSTAHHGPGLGEDGSCLGYSSVSAVSQLPAFHPLSHPSNGGFHSPFSTLLL